MRELKEPETAETLRFTHQVKKSRGTFSLFLFPRDTCSVSSLRQLSHFDFLPPVRRCHVSLAF
uniref:Uncharacterized protein n=1 Tax=Rhizophora mucronata TaxID=61149 RepID=A0A2P2PZ49_RHIMU